MALQAGKLDRRVTLERFAATRDEFNEEVKTWAPLTPKPVSASYEPLSDGERSRASEIAAAASARFVIRYSPAVADLNPKDRLTFNGVVHEILRVKEIGRREGLEISAASRADGAP